MIDLRIVSEGLAVSGLRNPIPPTRLALRFSAWAPADRGYRQLTKSTTKNTSPRLGARITSVVAGRRRRWPSDKRREALAQSEQLAASETVLLVLLVSCL